MCQKFWPADWMVLKLKNLELCLQIPCDHLQLEHEGLLKSLSLKIACELYYLCNTILLDAMRWSVAISIKMQNINR